MVQHQRTKCQIKWSAPEIALVLTDISPLTCGGLLCFVTHILSPNDFLKVAQQKPKRTESYNILSIKNKHIKVSLTFLEFFQE